jgi:hypothetical protein
VQGVQACNLGVPILAEELARHSGRDPQPQSGADMHAGHAVDEENWESTRRRYE